MADRPPERDDAGYDWLYGPAGKPDDATTRMPVQPRPDPPRKDNPAESSEPPARRSSEPPADESPEAPARSSEGQPTQVMPATGAPTPRPTTSESTRYAPPPARQPFGSPPDGEGAPPASPEAVGPTGGAPRGKRRRWWPRVILLLFVAWIVFLVAVPIWAWSKIEKVDAEPAGARPAEAPGTTYLLVGSDSRAGLSKQQEQQLGTGDAGGQRTDTIMLLQITSGGGPNVLLSIPRDSYVDIPGHGMNKVNAAFALGGPELLVQTIEHATDVRIDNYVEIGFTGFVSIVDAVGGVQICPKTAMKDPQANLDIPAGCQDADGATALGYVRSRHSDVLGDIGRGLRQRQVVSAVADKANSVATVLEPWRYFNLSSSAADSLRIGNNVGPIDLAKFAWAISHINDGLTCVVPYASLGESTSVGSVVTWDAQAADALFKHLAADDTSKVDCSATGQ